MCRDWTFFSVAAGFLSCILDFAGLLTPTATVGSSTVQRKRGRSAGQGSAHGAASKAAVFMQRGVWRHPVAARARRLPRNRQEGAGAAWSRRCVPRTPWRGLVDTPAAWALVWPRSIACGKDGEDQRSGCAARRGPCPCSGSRTSLAIVL